MFSVFYWNSDGGLSLVFDLYELYMKLMRLVLFSERNLPKACTAVNNIMLCLMLGVTQFSFIFVAVEY